MKALAALLVVVLLAGCASSPDSGAKEGDAPRVSQVGSTPATAMAVVLLDEEVALTPGGTMAWAVAVPANATDVHLTIVYPENFFHLGLHLSLAGCGQQDYGQGGSIGNGAGSWEYPVCKVAQAGTHDFTLTVDRGIVEGRAKLIAYVPKA